MTDKLRISKNVKLSNFNVKSQDLKSVSTCELVKELSTREGVDRTEIPYGIEFRLRVDGDGDSSYWCIVNNNIIVTSVSFHKCYYNNSHTF